MTFLIYHHAYFFQKGDFKKSEVATTPYLQTLTAYHKNFFTKMTAKDVKEIM